MAGRSRRKRNDAEESLKDAVTPTSRERYLFTIDRLTEENTLLRKQLDELKEKYKTHPVPQKQVEERTVVAAADSPQLPKNLPNKGCNCKGKCVNRICGCVKKNIPCNTACKCKHSTCQNKEQDKENNGGENVKAKLNTEVDKNVRNVDPLMPKKNLMEESPGEAAGTLRNSIFSPDITENHGRFLPNNKSECHTPLTFNTISKAVTFESDTDSSPEENRKPKRITVRARRELTVETTEQGKGKSVTGKPVTRRLISPYYNGRAAQPAPLEINDVGTDIPIKNEPVGKKGKAKKANQVSKETAAKSSENSQQKRLQKNESAEMEPGIVDPMKPTRQLQRTPVMASPHKIQPRVTPQTSRSPLQLPAVEKLSILPPERSESAQINLEEHYAQLVPCRLCARTFYPSRVEKHEASCKRI